MVDELKIDFGDGVSALDRTMRAIVMIANGAISSMEEMGWARESINIEIDEDDTLPCWVTLRGKRVFEVDYFVGPETTLKIKGIWIENVKKPGLISRMLGRI